MKRSHPLLRICIVAIIASTLACNLPSLTVPDPTPAAIQPTDGTPLPVATGTAPSTTAANPTSAPARTSQPFPITDSPGVTFEYTTRSGDTLEALARRFGVERAQILASPALPTTGYLPIGQPLNIANVLEGISPGGDLLPDAELVYSHTAVGFDLLAFVASAGGYLSSYVETLEDGSVLGGAAIVQRVANENSVNPRLLLALLEFRSGWVYGSPGTDDARIYPIGFRIPEWTGLYQELTVAAEQLNRGYYGWRLGTLVDTTAPDGGTVRWNPTLNAGSVALLHLFVLLSGSERWMEAVAGAESFPARYQAMFGDAWSRAEAAGPLIPSGLEQPPLELPFAAGEAWSLTAGPHNAWTSGTPRGALDFSPITDEGPCAVSGRWVTASAPGLIVRAEDNIVAIDLDGDGHESTGWALVYYHLAADGLVSVDARVATGDPLGHPSCEGGRATGKHVHIVRKYNGEWLAADGPIPFVLSGWRAVADVRNYYGLLVRGDEKVTSDSSGRQGSTIQR